MVQFGGQEPGTDTEIASFCELNHGVNFPLMKKSDVNGDNTSEVYKYLKNEKAGLLGLTRIKVRRFLTPSNVGVAMIYCTSWALSGTSRNSSLTRRVR